MLQPHIRLDTLNDVKYALLPGDPARLDKIAKFLENPQELAFNREFRSLRGKYKNINVLALSTGIGGSSAAIAVEELKKSASVPLFVSVLAALCKKTSIRAT